MFCKIMTRLEIRNLKVRILRLADLKSTGSPAELAKRFGISVRSVKRYISQLKAEGYNIWFCAVIGSYITEKQYT